MGKMKKSIINCKKSLKMSQKLTTNYAFDSYKMDAIDPCRKFQNLGGPGGITKLRLCKGTIPLKIDFSA